MCECMCECIYVSACVSVCNVAITITYGACLLSAGAVIKSATALSVVMVAWREMIA